VSTFDLAGYLRRIRRLADLSQRQLAEAAGMSKSAVAAAEAGTRDLAATQLARAAALAGLRLTLLDRDGREVVGMSPDGPRDAADRRLPAHLDTLHTSDGPDWEQRQSRPQPWFTFALDRVSRDRARDRDGIPADHHVPEPGDSPWERAAARRREYWRRRAEERERRLLAGELRGMDLGFDCTCPPRCDELDDYSGRPVHAEGCPCSCDVG
jgi:transcriptional regulator with XRE-family HTH domain